MEQGLSMVNVGSAHYMGNQVAVGNYAALIFNNNTPHDVAALKVLVEEAGGRVTDLWGKEQRYDRPVHGALISNGTMHEKLLGLTSQLLPEKVR